jgi:hypothetical protein
MTNNIAILEACNSRSLVVLTKSRGTDPRKLRPGRALWARSSGAA